MLLGFKSLVLAISGRRSQMIIDQELIGELGRKGTHSLSDTEAGGRYIKRNWEKNSQAAVSIANYTRSKIELLEDMVRQAIKATPRVSTFGPMT